MKKLKPLGGQAIMEGVMIKSTDNVSMAVRAPDGKIIAKRDKFTSLADKNKFFKLPFIRGIVTLFEMLIIGIKALTWSANQQGEDEELGPWEWFVTGFFAIGLTILLFVIAPYYGAKLLFSPDTFVFAFFDGLLRLMVFLGYIAGIGFMKDIKRMYQYHGAEHMAVHCYEHKEKLTIENVEKYPPEHPRCGTNLLFIVIIVSILMFSVIRSQYWCINIPARILLIPFVAGISYEILKAASKYKWLHWLSLPGLWAQKITTKKPTAKQIEVAIAAVDKARR